MRHNSKPLLYNGIEDIQNKMSGDSTALAFRLPKQVTSVPLKSIKGVAGAVALQPASIGGVLIMYKIGNTLTSKKTGAILLLLIAMFTAFTAFTGRIPFTKIGATIIVLFCVVVSLAFLHEDHKESKV